MTRHVLFRSEQHVEKHYADINGQPPGSRLAECLIKRLGEADIRTQPEPSPEDFGWYFKFGKNASYDHICIIAFRPDKKGLSGDWMIGIEKNTGLVGRMIGGHKKISMFAPLAIHEVLREESVYNIRWFHDKDLNQEVNARPQPEME